MTSCCSTRTFTTCEFTHNGSLFSYMCAHTQTHTAWTAARGFRVLIGLFVMRAAVFVFSFRVGGERRGTAAKHTRTHIRTHTHKQREFEVWEAVIEQSNLQADYSSCHFSPVCNLSFLCLHNSFTPFAFFFCFISFSVPTHTPVILARVFSQSVCGSVHFSINH